MKDDRNVLFYKDASVLDQDTIYILQFKIQVKLPGWACPNFNSNKPHQALRSEIRLIEKHYVSSKYLGRS